MKILIISHNPMSTYNNMGKTLYSLFSSFSQKEICQLYVYPSIPNVDMCESYYQMTDKQVLKSVLWGNPGKEIVSNQICEVNKDRASGKLHILPFANKSSAFIRLSRDFMWKFSRWYSKGLREWLDRESPTCIFVAPGYAKFIYDIALRIAKDRSLPIVTYICDDYYFLNKPRGLLDRIQLSLLQKKIDCLMASTDRLVVISEELKEAYYARFGVLTDVIMTGADISKKSDFREDTKIHTISYFGNLSVGRCTSLADIGRSVDDINYDNGTDLVVQVYTSDTSANRLRAFDGIKCIKLCGFVSGKAFLDALVSSDLLIHTESFDDSNKDLVKYSVSTKIADSLAVGIPLFAYGPEYVSSMKHLLRNNCAIIATAKDELRQMLESALFDKDLRLRVTQNSIKTAAIYHDKERNSAKLKSIFSEIGQTNE